MNTNNTTKKIVNWGRPLYSTVLNDLESSLNAPVIEILIRFELDLKESVWEQIERYESLYFSDIDTWEDIHIVLGGLSVGSAYIVAYLMTKYPNMELKLVELIQSEISHRYVLKGIYPLNRKLSRGQE